ncbi:uncharacterized protein FMAN_05850 [Fusarium mangiferae]|uniref:RRM domain-containing protein n=1 Tax=Fusarium mangiferae TaxID=192010 RepID=A0A1L7SSW3_FUSMA|nr:uncharacterized protein FMAN_05850 [Fusarium mangiferae]CVK86924.1 uncharacterized protein FMAN_05850 [Fusarium mangiferae]
MSTSNLSISFPFIEENKLWDLDGPFRARFPITILSFNMTIHKPPREIVQQSIADGVVTNIGSLNYETPKTEVHKLLQDHDFSVEIYLPNFEPVLGESDLGNAIRGWYWVQFERKEDAQRAKEVLNGTILYGRRIKTESITHQPGPKPPKSSRDNGTFKNLASRSATRATSESFLSVSAAPSSFTIETSSSTVSFLTANYPDEARAKHIKSDYASRGLVIGPDLTQRQDTTLTPLSQSVPSPHPCNKDVWLQTFIQVFKRGGARTEMKKIPTTDLPKFQAQGYSQYFHPVKSSTNLFMTGMIASGLAVKLMPGEELVTTLPSKNLVELTMPMTEEEKQQVQQEKGPKYYWKPGRLTGANAAAEAGISDPSCAFFSPPSEMDSRNRSATCSSHMQQHPRPAAVGVGWGGFDRFREWQLHGRQVKRDSVEYEPFSKEPKSTLDIVTETGEVTMTIPMDVEDFKPEPSLLKTLTLWEKLNGGKGKQVRSCKKRKDRYTGVRG